MAAGGAVCRYSPHDTSQENAEANRGEEGSMHERLVAYVHALDHGARRGVWGEHSYARGEGEAGARGAGRAMSLLAPRPPSPPERSLDVERVEPEPGAPPGEPRASDTERASEEEPEPAEEEEEDWEARLAALAPSPAHARLAAAACDALRRMRLARLARGPGAAQAAARRLRLALARAGGAREARGAWLQSALGACMPAWARREHAATLRARGAARRPPGLRAPLGAQTEPWLVWVSSGCAALDARWERRLAGLVHTRVLRAAGGAAGAPEAWCAGAAGAARSQLTDALAEAGDRSIILGGCGAGAALCLLLARGAGGAAHGAGGVRGAVLLAPPLHTAEGALPLGACRLPLLLLVGTRASNQPRAQAHRVAELSGASAEAGAGWGPRRVLEVHGADEQLRLPRRLRHRLALPQHALDAALAEECVRWALETAEGEAAPASPPPPPPPPLQPRRHQLPTIVHQIDLDAPEEDYAHLPQASTAAAPPAPHAPPAPLQSTPQSSRSIEIVEGRVVSRAAGGTPLPLLPPARRPAPPSPAPPAPLAPLAPLAPSAQPSPADIMQMPIVFADDNATDSSSTGSPVTVTSGKARGSSVTPPVKMTRVILAKRGVRVRGGGAEGAGGRAPPPGLVSVRGGGAEGAGAGLVSVRGGGARGARRLLVRRGMRLVSRHDRS